jgi:hypothetical protein
MLGGVFALTPLSEVSLTTLVYRVNSFAEFSVPPLNNPILARKVEIR